MPLSFVLAGPADADLLAGLERTSTTDALAHIFGTERPYPIDDVRARWAIVLDDPETATLLAYDVEPIGYAAIDRVELRHFGVIRARFGTGAADALHAEAMRRMTASAGDAPRLWVLAENHRARRFYERRGWLADGRSGQSEFPPYPTQLGYTYRP